jgi:hypothetical protein
MPESEVFDGLRICNRLRHNLENGSKTGIAGSCVRALLC